MSNLFEGEELQQTLDVHFGEPKTPEFHTDLLLAEQPIIEATPLTHEEKREQKRLAAKAARLRVQAEGLERYYQQNPHERPGFTTEEVSVLVTTGEPLEVSEEAKAAFDAIPSDEELAEGEEVAAVDGNEEL